MVGVLTLPHMLKRIGHLGGILEAALLCVLHGLCHDRLYTAAQGKADLAKGLYRHLMLRPYIGKQGIHGGPKAIDVCGAVDGTPGAILLGSTEPLCPQDMGGIHKHALLACDPKVDEADCPVRMEHHV